MTNVVGACLCIALGLINVGFGFCAGISWERKTYEVVPLLVTVIICDIFLLIGLLT